MTPDLSLSNLWTIRHAETESNRKNVFMGGLDVPATAAGLRQAAALGGSLRGQFDHVFSSPLARAAATAAALFPGVRITHDDRLRERGLGVWEGLPKADVRREQPWAFPNAHLDVCYTPPGGEELDSLLARVGSFLADIAPLARTSRVLVVSHNGWIRTAQYLSAEASLDDFHAFPVAQLVPTPMRIR
ncbi:histidine phosphatase family protein [Pseudonocardia acidicola]|uniref:Histidine phosphatase family protein n=1 Tax=Pseudonocardia acidicola TaxID=2724939 RepID=A0ABX1S8N6_9PSEU|nr:histidine phosphatase family protein [Pseudonocardia acidicola]NMH97929.1 histidine phosphatase family protein [Pseudonocardia acidicola]